ncbi:hypothetical protein EJK54_0970 [Moraxella catarrhalis]|uniref:Uncharacterized protein n=1 Tax=Moraxella catarrhalis TaxID=480 RepID=A0ABY0BK81_MORCA|nr:hypothetical protein EJK54_0970 [Moraxella catarrhalis]
MLNMHKFLYQKKMLNHWASFLLGIKQMCAVGIKITCHDNNAQKGKFDLK